MPSHRSRAAQALVVVLTGALFIGAAHLLLSAAADAQNRRQLEELNGLALRRAELAIDYAFTALGETAEQGIVSCDEAVLEVIRRHVYQRSTVKDIRVVHESGQVICSAFPKTLSFDLGEVAADDTLVSRNEQVRLFRLDQQSGSALGVRWRILDEIGLVAVVGTDALLYDMLPTELRDHSGYATLVGERGVKLSGGERQRVALARAFLADAPILILDEATSSLDSESEILIQQAMARLMQGRTAIVIAHRLSTVRAMDRILVFERGRILEEGSHVELIRRDGGLYRSLFEKQAGEFSRGLQVA